MSGKNNFAALKQFATKVYKFQQGTSLALLDPAKAVHGNAINAVQLTDDEFAGVKGGICATLATQWLHEKLGSSKQSVFTGPSGGSAVHAGRNLETVSANVPKFLTYTQSPSARNALKAFGLAPSEKADFQPILQRPVLKTRDVRTRDGGTRVERVTVSEIRFTDSLVNACKPEFLKQGRGLLFEFQGVSRNPEKRGGGHAVAAYRSRGNTLYFFDPNCGVYDINDEAAFFAAYTGCYDALGYTLDIYTNLNNDFTYVDR